METIAGAGKFLAYLSGDGGSTFGGRKTENSENFFAGGGFPLSIALSNQESPMKFPILMTMMIFPFSVNAMAGQACTSVRVSLVASCVAQVRNKYAKILQSHLDDLLAGKSDAEALRAAQAEVADTATYFNRAKGQGDLQKLHASNPTFRSFQFEKVETEYKSTVNFASAQRRTIPKECVGKSDKG